MNHQIWLNNDQDVPVSLLTEFSIAKSTTATCYILDLTLANI